MSHNIATPIEVMEIMTTRLVALCPKSLNIDIRFPALESLCACFDALNRVIAREQGLAGIADGRVERFTCAGEDGGRDVVSVAAERYFSTPWRLRECV